MWLTGGDDPRLLRTFSGHTQAIYSISFSPDGKTVASAGDDTIRLWSIAAGAASAIIKTGQVTCVAFNNDGKTLASGFSDDTIHLWDVATRKSVATLTGNSEQVVSVAFSPDGRTLASASTDKTVRLWNAR